MSDKIKLKFDAFTHPEFSNPKSVPIFLFCASALTRTIYILYGTGQGLSRLHLTLGGVPDAFLKIMRIIILYTSNNNIYHNNIYTVNAFNSTCLKFHDFLCKYLSRCFFYFTDNRFLMLDR